MMPPEIREKMERLAEAKFNPGGDGYLRSRKDAFTDGFTAAHQLMSERVESLETALKEYGSHDYSCNLHEAQYGSPAFIAGCNCGFSKLIGERADG